MRTSVANKQCWICFAKVRRKNTWSKTMASSWLKTDFHMTRIWWLSPKLSRYAVPKNELTIFKTKKWIPLLDRFPWNLPNHARKSWINQRLVALGLTWLLMRKQLASLSISLYLASISGDNSCWASSCVGSNKLLRELARLIAGGTDPLRLPWDAAPATGESDEPTHMSPRLLTMHFRTSF